MKKRILALVLATAMVFGVVGCGKKKDKEEATGASDRDSSYQANKSYTRIDSYGAEKREDHKYFHFSIDDTIDCFKDISEKDYKSVFDNNFFSWLKYLHDNYGIVITCYVYYESDSFCLENCTHKYTSEFIENSSWLRFGFHTLRSDITYDKSEIAYDYEKTINALKMIVGEESIDNVIRLQSYKGSRENIIQIKNTDNQPIVGLLTADDTRKSYYLEDKRNQYIYCHDVLYDDEMKIYFFSTDLRVEYIEDVEKKLEEFSSSSWNNQLDYLEVFTHEWLLSPELKEMTEEICEWQYMNGYDSCFAEDVIGGY